MYEITEYNCETGETIIRPMTEEEIVALPKLNSLGE